MYKKLFIYLNLSIDIYFSIFLSFVFTARVRAREEMDIRIYEW